MIKIDWQAFLIDTGLFKKLGIFIFTELQSMSIGSLMSAKRLRVGWSLFCLRGGYNNSSVIYRLRGNTRLSFPISNK